VTTRRSARDALVDAALAEFSEHGYEASTVADIAARAGVTTGALYAHFASKLELLVAAIGLASPRKYAATLARAYAMRTADHADLFDDELALSGERRLLLLDVIVHARRDPEVAATLRRGFEAYLSAMTRVTAEGVEAGILDPAIAVPELARLGAAISLGNLVLEALGERPPSRAAFAQLTEALMRSERGEAPETDPALARVRGRAAAVSDATTRLHEAIGEAAAAGHSLRRIGDAAGLSHERVRRLLGELDAG
jgi:AcrR family transcriptional regulator